MRFLPFRQFQRGRLGRGIQGGNAEPSERIPPPARERGAEQKILPFLLEEIFSGAREIKMIGKIFCEAGRRLRRLAAGRVIAPRKRFAQRI